jgi:RHO1 GDP-GTP exchange protein 1/2
VYHSCLLLRCRHIFHCKLTSLNDEQALSHFQAGELKESDEEWHLLVPPEARDALGKVEVQRQSVIFEIIKSEREYVADLEAVERVSVAHPARLIPSRLNNNLLKVFIDQLRAATPPIIPEPDLKNFIHKVFGNIHEILVYHQQILAALYARQREQHPLILSVADIFLQSRFLLAIPRSHAS